MKLYNVFVKKNFRGRIEDIKLAKEGFSLYAFGFTTLWFLFKKMWKEAILTIMFYLVIIKTGASYFEEFKLAFEISFALLIGFNANVWMQNSLKRSGYVFSGAAFGRDEDEARVNFLKNKE